MFATVAIMLAAALCLPRLTAAAQGPSGPDEPPQGLFPDASFETLLRKYTPPANPYSPFYSWEAHMVLDLTVLRRGTHSAGFTTAFQSVGTENFGSRIGVGGTGYVVAFDYAHARSPDLTWSVGLSHLSSHLTRDLDDKLDEEQARGERIPVVRDPGQYNVVFFELFRRWPMRRFAPEFELTIQPVNLNLRGGWAGARRPVYVGSRWRLWRGNEKSVVAETQHELGPNMFNRVALVLSLRERDDAPGRVQLFVSVSPGSELHVSPHIGGVRDGVSFGLRMMFED